MVGIISGLTGGGLVWLFTRGPASPHSNRARQITERASLHRIGQPQPYRSNAAFEVVAKPDAPLPTAPTETPESRSSPSVVQPIGEKSADLRQRIERFTLAPTPATPLLGLTVLPARPPAPASAPPVHSRLTRGTVEFEDALMATLKAAAPYRDEGFTVREDAWGGPLDSTQQVVTFQLFRGNEYWFWAGTDRRPVGVELHAYDAQGNLAESEHWQRENQAATHVIPSRSGTYYVVVSRKSMPGSRGRGEANWVMTYGFR